MNEEEISAGLQRLGKRLAELLDEDQFAECEALLLAVAPSLPRRSSVVDGLVVTVINPDSRTVSEYVVTANDVIALWDRIVELQKRLDVMTQCADNYSRMFEESAEECEHLKDCQENDMLHIAGLVAERDTLRQQRDLLAGLLRMVRQDGWYHPLEEHEIAQIDAALAKQEGKA